MNTLRSLVSWMMTIVVIALVALVFSVLSASPVHAGDVPTRTAITNASSTAATWTVPAFNNGHLLKVQVYDASGTNDTLTMTHVVPVSSTRSMTNACASVPLVANATYSLETVVTNDYTVPGDSYRFAFGSVTGNVCVTRSIDSP